MAAGARGLPDREFRRVLNVGRGNSPYKWPAPSFSASGTVAVASARCQSKAGHHAPAQIMSMHSSGGHMSGGAFQETYADLYDRYLVPLQFGAYAGIVAEKVKTFGQRSVLELAAGTGILTHELALLLPPDMTITGTDLNQPMIDQAKAKPGMERVMWRQADAMDLPFPNENFDIVVSAFGVMFFPDKAESFREARRVLRHKGRYLFVVWDDWKRMPDAPLAIAADVVAGLLACDPASLVNPPYHDEDAIRGDLRAANFEGVVIDRVTRPATASSAHDAAMATVHGSLIRTVIEKIDIALLDEATNAVAQALHRKFGGGAIAGETHALMITAEKP